MKSGKSEITRIKNLIENDRVNAGYDFSRMVESDLRRLLSDYFDLSSPVHLDVVRINDGLGVTITLTANRIKSFMTVPHGD
ncbi:MAG: hypothetical protein E7369_04105 [Clostridiales bacterium]|nr:hypothetical protein [Clostridiales bacterium]